MTSAKINRYYYYDYDARIIYHCTHQLNTTSLIFLGESDNPNVKMAAAAFTKNMKQRMNHMIKEIVD